MELCHLIIYLLSLTTASVSNIIYIAWPENLVWFVIHNLVT